MEGRHCLAAASVIATLAGEIPSEAAAKESEFLWCSFLFVAGYCVFPCTSIALLNAMWWLLNENKTP